MRDQYLLVMGAPWSELDERESHLSSDVPGTYSRRSVLKETHPSRIDVRLLVDEVKSQLFCCIFPLAQSSGSDMP